MPRHASPTLASLVLAAGLAGLASAPARAQFNVIGPGSTPQGDILRGAGVFYDGLGRYELNSSMGRSIDADTMIRWNQYVYESIQEYNRQRAERIKARQDRRTKAIGEIQARLRDAPTEQDLTSGDALNVLLMDLLNPKLTPSTLRTTRVPLPARMLQGIPFQYARLAGVISLQRLTVQDGWPLALRGEAFKAERAAYAKAIERVLELNVEAELTPEAVKAVRDAVKAIQAKVAATIPASDRAAFMQAHQFVRDLEKGVELLHVPLVEDVLASIDQYPGTTVAELLEFMQRYNLRFSPAERPAERQAYKELYAALARQREVVGENAGVAEAPPEPPAPAEK